MRSGVSWWKAARCGAAVLAGAVLVACGGPDPAPPPESEPEAEDDGGSDGKPQPATEPREEKDPEEAPAPEDEGADDEGTATWTTVPATGEEGETTIYDCPEGSLEDGGAVWGDDPYTDDSAVCPAAVHAGMITPEEGGEVMVELLPGQDSYGSSEQNGVETSSWNSWPGSFTFVEEDSVD